MKKEEIKELVAELFREQMATRPSVFRRLWEWATPYISTFLTTAIVFALGMLTMAIIANYSPLTTKTTLEHQAAIGGAVIPFPNASPLPSPWNSLPGDWTVLLLEGEIVDSPLTNTSAPPLPSNPQADAGQAPSTRLLRPLIRRMQ